MNRDEAETETARLNSALARGAMHRWFARAGDDGSWSLVKVGGLVGAPVDPLKAIEAKPRPPQPDDPRPAYWQNTGGPWVA